MPARRYWVRGRVQGVFFRATTRDKARALGLDGYVRNLPDGRVEVLASGDAEDLESLERFLREGPQMARVDGVDREGAQPPDQDGFHVTS